LPTLLPISKNTVLLVHRAAITDEIKTLPCPHCLERGGQKLLLDALASPFWEYKLTVFSSSREIEISF